MIGATWDARNRNRVPLRISASKTFVDLESIAIARSCKVFLALDIIKR